ncbi:hypothetical protein ACH4S8_37180 [Streptomyces sp. NPDC021080]|uniref:hypothetical protein n=1 Tax=Streptomyces sp. NPDC021080 TaxID=3365110 RepID=UPI0037BAA93C
MTNRRKVWPAPGQHCSSTKGQRPCYDPAVWVVFYADKETCETKHANACGGHLNRLCDDLTPQAEYSREMFRVLPWAAIVAAHEEKRAAT